MLLFLSCKILCIGLQRVKGSHTHDVLATQLNSILREYKIQNKVVRIVTDNASNFVKAFRVFGQDQSPEDSDSDEEEENITSVEFLPGESTSVVLPPHQRCAAHTLNLVASKDSEAALQDGAFRTASRSLFAKAQAVWNKQSRVVSAAESIQEATGRQMIIPNQTRWNSTYDAVQCLQDLTAEQLTKLADALGLPRFTPETSSS
ncbi:uncharacterized protein LOC112564105 [Pomacea canaliculata]|uniref:uncharacterized protein LOC112564105 n=1 Tax=Pomacea canaliculata TaxID=400727 RepID=UPI000D73E82E|nr:uncharacterized protein LOC112564105 [Pomacea canaliculata]